MKKMLALKGGIWYISLRLKKGVLFYVYKNL